MDFYENFFDRMINSKCQVILSDFSNTSLPGVFGSQGWESLCEKPIKCPSLFRQEFYSNMHAIDISVPQFTMVFKGTRIVVTSDFLSSILHVPMLDRPNYPNRPYLRNTLRHKQALLFCEKAMVWGDTLNLSIIEFAKGPRILNIVMTFVLTPWSHYNSIIEPCACFLLSFLEDLSIDFPSYMIVSMIDIETLLHVISSSFLHLSLAFSHTCMSPFLLLLSFTPWVPLARNLVG